VKFSGFGEGGHLNDRRGRARGIGVRNRKCGRPLEASIQKFDIQKFLSTYKHIFYFCKTKWLTRKMMNAVTFIIEEKAAS
jgi:hypothetical protein